MNLPIGTTEDRLLGGLNLGEALEGQAKLKRGLVQEAHAGVLYIDEVNLLSDSLTDALLDVASSGHFFIERDGFSASADARFVLIGSMNIEEGALRPQLTDRFALSLEVEAPAASQERAAIIEARLWFDSSPDTFCAAHESEQLRLRQAILNARRLISRVEASAEIVRTISEAVLDAGVRSLRADLAALRAATAHAALAGRTDISVEDAEAVLPLVLNHRTKRNPGKPPSPPQADDRQGRHKEAEDGGGSVGNDRVFPIERQGAPELRVNLADAISRGRTASVELTSDAPLDVVASFSQSFRNTGRASLQSEQLVFRKPPVTSGVRFIFVVDASGSQSAQQRMRAVKGAVALLLESSVDHKDEVAVISFRGAKAEIVLAPCRDADASLRVLEFLPTGGRTPLAHALSLAASLVNDASLLILLTDGRANVALTSDDPWKDALEEAEKLNCSSVLVDSSIDSSAGSAMKSLASALGGTQIHLDELSKETLINVLRR